MEEEYELGKILKERRRALGWSIRELCQKVENNRLAGMPFSPAYYSQVETGNGMKPEKISFDFLFALSVVFECDPVELFVISRPNIPDTMRDPAYRKKIFKVFV